MRELGFEYQKQHGYSTYKISIDELNNIAKKRKWLHELDKDLMMKPSNDDNECMFIDKTDKAEYIRAENHKQLLDKLKKVEQSNKYITNDLNDAMKYIAQLEKYVYKMESNEIYDEDMEVVDEVDKVDEVVDEDTDETDVDVDEPSNETDDDKKDNDFIEIGRNVFQNKKRTKFIKCQMIIALMKIYFKSIIY